jgi:hypothetical protein
LSQCPIGNAAFIWAEALLLIALYQLAEANSNEYVSDKFIHCRPIYGTVDNEI